MKIKWLPILFLFIFIGDRIGGYLANHVMVNSGFWLMETYQVDEVDLVFIGNSRTLPFNKDVVQKSWGLSSLLLAYNGMDIRSARMFLEDYLERGGRVKEIWIELSICDREPKQFSSNLQSFRRFSSRINHHFESENNSLLSRYSHLLPYNSELFLRCVASFCGIRQNTEVLDTMKSVTSSNEIDNIELKEEMLQELEKVRKLIAIQNIPIRLFIMPLEENYSRVQESFFQAVDSLESHLNLDVHDYTSILKEKRYFKDSRHINDLGSTHLIEYIRANDPPLTILN